MNCMFNPGKRFILVILCLTGLGSWLPVNAVAIDGLYEALVPVSGQDRAERDKAIKLGLAEVIVKLTGRLEAPELPEVSPILAAAGRMIEQFRYQEREVAAGEMPVSEQGPVMQSLWMRFDKQALDSRLQSANLPIWGRIRPATVAWIAIDNGAGQRYIAGAEEAREAATYVHERAGQRGIQVLLPLLDLEDRIAVSFADIWADFSEVILQAAARYQTEAVFIGRVHRNADGFWHGQWTQYLGKDSQRWSSTSTTQREAIDAGIDGLAGHLATRFARRYSADNSTLMLTIEDVASLEDYERALRYLRSLNIVSSARLVRVEANRIAVMITLQGEANGLIQTIALSNTLARIEQGGEEQQPLAAALPVANTGVQALSYHLLP